MKLYNTLTRKIEPIKKSGQRITLYVCGITPYDTTHLGHAFTYVTFDTLIRFLKWRGYKVSYTQNVTDIDDPLFQRARELGVHWKQLGDKWTDRFIKDMKLLNVLPPNHFPRVTDEIEMIIRLVKKLYDSGFAYKKNGTVYFDISKAADYGKLSKLSREKMIEISRERGADPDDPKKKNPLDFILWQPAKKDEPEWDSPWGKGRPGWHIECSAMAIKYLGEQITIHGGGKDLIFPHHESEIAQSEAFTDKKPFVYHWMHIGMVGYQGEKMSKSLGNLILVNELAKKYSPLAIRWYLISHHYRQDWQFKEEKLKEAEIAAKKIIKAAKLPIKKINHQALKYKQQFIDCLSTDFQTNKAVKIIQQLAEDQIKNNHQVPLFNKLLKVLGLPLFSSFT